MKSLLFALFALALPFLSSAFADDGENVGYGMCIAAGYSPSSCSP